MRLVFDDRRCTGMTWKWTWNAIWIAGLASLVLDVAFDVPLDARVLLFPVAILVCGLIEGARSNSDDAAR
jgi:hypothetical protein